MPPWLPGQSGNPRGRPRAAFDLAAEARKYAPLALDALVACLQDPDKRLGAAAQLLDRGYGRPLPGIASTDDATSLTFLHLMAARAIAHEIYGNGANGHATIESKPVADETTPDLSQPALE